MTEKLRERNRFAKKLRRMRSRKGIERKEDIEVRGWPWTKKKR